ncbi:MAG: hypothetical protein AAGF47_09655 [Planctomycetota bacterium]
MPAALTGLFADPADASAAIQTLENRGVPTGSISLIAGENVDTNSFAIETHSKLPEGVAIGAAAGGALGALVAGFAAVGTISTGGIGLLAAGPALAAFAGAGVGATGGSILGGSIGCIVPKHEIKHYEDAISKGSVLVGVECPDDDTHRSVQDVLEHFDAIRVSNA